MRQRVAFLRTLLAGKPVLCLDEPFGALDAITRCEMQEWLARTLQREPRTVVLVTHDVEEAVCWRIAWSCSRRARDGSSPSSRWRSSGPACAPRAPWPRCASGAGSARGMGAGVMSGGS